MNNYEKYNLDKNEVVEVSILPLYPTRYIYIHYHSVDYTRMGYEYQDSYYKHQDIYINKNGKLVFITRGKITDYFVLLLFLKKYRECPELLVKILDNFDVADREIQLKKMQIMLRPMNRLEEFKNNLQLATVELPVTSELNYFGDGLIFVDKKENLGSIIDISGKESPDIKKWMITYNETRWERGVLYNEEREIYECWYIPERSNEWSRYEKFYDKSHLFEYLLNFEIGAIR